MVGIITALTVPGISMVITRIAPTALSITGLSVEAARFQARSAFTGSGFTTPEAEQARQGPKKERQRKEI